MVASDLDADREPFPVSELPICFRTEITALTAFIVMFSHSWDACTKVTSLPAHDATSEAVFGDAPSYK